MSEKSFSTRARRTLRGGAGTLGAAAIGIGVLAAPAALDPAPAASAAVSVVPSVRCFPQVGQAPTP